MGSSALLADLAASLEAKNETAIIENLNNILTQGTEIELDNNKLARQVMELNNETVTKLFVEVVAEWCKIDKNRRIFTDRHIIDFLLDLLESRDEEMQLESIRALGNICYENEEARTIIDRRGLTLILSILKDVDRDTELVLKASGFMVNLLVSNDDLQKEALRLDIVGIIENLLNKYVNTLNQTLVIFLLGIVNSCIDYIDELNIPFNESLCRTVIKLFKMSTTPQLAVTCLEILHGQSDKDDVKTLMAQGGVCELVFDLIGQYKDQVNCEDTRAVLKMACDLIVIILTGDDCMILLYDNGKGKTYLNMLSWLDSEDSDLLSTGVLALGNFARKEAHCVQMVQEGVSKKLIELLKKYNTNQSDIKVQHALLSTLKNLVIPQPNKAKILSEGLIDVIYPMIEIEQYLVVFKLLGTFRMVIDGQEKAAQDLLSRKDFLTKLIFWCDNSDHLGVRGEVPRLLAWLIKHSRSFKPFDAMTKVEGCVKCVVEMTSSNHAVMQNESFYAITMLCKDPTNRCPQPSPAQQQQQPEQHSRLTKQLIDADIGKNLSFVVGKYGDKMDEKTIDNMLMMLDELLAIKPVADHLKSGSLAEALGKLPDKQEKLNKIVNLLK